MSRPRFRIIRNVHCPDGNTCEKILRFENDPPEVRHVIFKVETDPDKLAAARHLVGPGEVLGYTTLIPDVT